MSTIAAVAPGLLVLASSSIARYTPRKNVLILLSWKLAIARDFGDASVKSLADHRL